MKQIIKFDVNANLSHERPQSNPEGMEMYIYIFFFMYLLDTKILSYQFYKLF